MSLHLAWCGYDSCTDRVFLLKRIETLNGYQSHGTLKFGLFVPSTEWLKCLRGCRSSLSSKLSCPHKTSVLLPILIFPPIIEQPHIRSYVSRVTLLPCGVVPARAPVRAPGEMRETWFR